MTQVTMSGGKVVLRAGEVGTGQDCCCCDCEFPFPEGVTPSVSGTLTLPDVAGDCPAGEYAFACNFVYMPPVQPGYFACCDIELAEGITVSVGVLFLCSDGTMTSAAFLNTYPCGSGTPQCLVCNGQSVGVGLGGNDSYHTHQPVEVDGVCKPTANEQVTFNFPCDITITYTITV